MTVKIKKWGNSLGIRLPKKLADAKNLSDGNNIELIATAEGILIRKKQDISMEAILDGFPDDYTPDEEVI